MKLPHSILPKTRVQLERDLSFFTNPRVTMGFYLFFGLFLGVMLMTASACRDEKRHFEPAPKIEAPEDDDDAGSDDDENLGPSLVVGEDDGKSAKTDGEGDGGAVGGESVGGKSEGEDGQLSRKQASALVAFLDNDLAVGISASNLFTKLAHKCAEVDVCVGSKCREALSACSGDDKSSCGSRLMATCPAFSVFAQGAIGDALDSKTDIRIRELWRDMPVKIRLALPDSKQDRVDELAERHQL